MLKWNRLILLRSFVGKYLELLDAYKSLIEALTHAGIKSKTRVVIDYVDAEKIEREGVEVLDGASAILVPGGLGNGDLREDSRCRFCKGE